MALRRIVRIGPAALLPLQFLISIYGGYFGARLTRVLPPWIVRGCVVALTATVTLAFFIRLP